MRVRSPAVWLTLCMAACAPAVSAPTAFAAPPSPSPFAITDFGMHALGAHEAPDDQAAGHPYSLTSNFDFTVAEGPGGAGGLQPTEDVKDVVLDLPEGLAIDAQVAPMCQLDQLNLGGAQTACPAASRIGTLGLHLAGEAPGQLETVPVALYNMLPAPGYPQEFGANYLGLTILMYGSVVRTASGYGLRLAVPDVSQLAGIIGASLTLFGDPAVSDGDFENSAPLLTNPADCVTGAPAARLEVDTWQHPGQYHAAEATVYQALRECDLLRFEPSLDVVPEATQAEVPSGYELRLRLPQAQIWSWPAAPELKGATVTLPAGVSVSPASVNSLVGCPAAGASGINLGSAEVSPQGQDLGDPEASELGGGGLYHSVPGRCPQASTVGTVEIETPLSMEPLEGHVYVAQSSCDGPAQSPCTEADASGSMFGLYLEVEGSGVLLKLPASLAANPATDQLTLSLEDLPQLPLSSLRLRLRGGPHALLVNPGACGTFVSTARLSAWSSPPTLPATATSSFAVSRCSSTSPAAPAPPAPPAVPPSPQNPLLTPASGVGQGVGSAGPSKPKPGKKAGKGRHKAGKRKRRKHAAKHGRRRAKRRQRGRA